ncbi:MAG: RdgB/HAM1 family non-canonical purine NTP pyrophosphatase [Defluviitaleaceae bacterium]|nr:RdgB/HAM1 family non-canonical purine NTP pyrophosphatase [Defluviitaleaceae bacterium]
MIYLLATNNPGKAKEIAPLFEEAGLRLISLADLGLSFEAREDGETFLANAMQKAWETAAFLRERGHLQVAVLADDSGLAIDALDGAPGVHSALFMGRDTPYPIRCNAILDMLQEQRTARFVCNLVCLFPDDTSLTAVGTIDGSIAYEIHGEGGFGYDPIFFYPPLGKTLAQLTKDEKNAVSHRGKAIKKMIGLIINADTCTQ